MHERITALLTTTESNKMHKQNASVAQLAEYFAAGRCVTKCRPARARGARYFAFTTQRSKHAGKPNYMRGKRVA